MTIHDYLRGLSDADLVRHLDEFSGDEEPGWVSLSVSVTPYGSLTKTLVEREIDRRASPQ